MFLTRERHIKLGDLGVSKIVHNVAFLNVTRVGTPLYLAPEMVKQLPYDYKIDIWALGVVAYHLTNLQAPFRGDNLIELGKAILNNQPKPIPNAYSPKLQAFIC